MSKKQDESGIGLQTYLIGAAMIGAATGATTAQANDVITEWQIATPGTQIAMNSVSALDGCGCGCGCGCG